MSTHSAPIHGDPLTERSCVRLPRPWAHRLTTHYPSRSAGVRAALTAALPDPTPHPEARRACLADHATVRATVRLGAREAAAIERAATTDSFADASHVVRCAVWEVVVDG